MNDIIRYKRYKNIFRDYAKLYKCQSNHFYKMCANYELALTSNLFQTKKAKHCVIYTVIHFIKYRSREFAYQ